MAQVVCTLCACRLEWTEVDTDEILCSVCGHSLDDDHSAATSEEVIWGLEEVI